jgi:hypothetical protein
MIPLFAAGLLTLYQKAMELKKGKRNREAKRMVAFR